MSQMVCCVAGDVSGCGADVCVVVILEQFYEKIFINVEGTINAAREAFI